MALALALALLPLETSGYTLVLLADILVFALFAASLHFLMSVGGLASFGHAAYFGLGAYGVAFLASDEVMNLLRALPEEEQAACDQDDALGVRA